MKNINLVTEEFEEKEVKVNTDFILELRAEAARQKIQKNAKEFAKTFGNNGNDVPRIDRKSISEINKIIESFEIIEE